MPWKEKTVKESREEFVKRVLSHEKSKTALCREYGISRPTGDLWIKRYLNGQPMDNRSRAPFKTANKIDEETEKLIVDYRQSHPSIGAVKIQRILENKGLKNIPCGSTVNAILKRNNCITREASQASTPCKRFEKEAPNDMWQADFKGHFQMTDGNRCRPLNIIDDHSRYNLCSDALSTETFADVQSSMLRLFYKYGIPFSFLCDNGNPWGTAQSTGYTRFEVWLMELGILTVHGRIYHPQTQGKEEKYNGNMKRELLNHTTISDFADAQRKFDYYREFYNNERPHHALNLDVPAKHYTPSKRHMPAKIEDWEYGKEYETRRVKSTGFVTYRGQGYFLSESLGEKVLGIGESSLPGCVNLYFRQFRIARIDVDRRAFSSKRIYLADGDPRFELLKN